MEELTLEKALEYLKEGIILRLIDNKFTLVKLNKNKVLINNQNSNIILNLEQFKELYKDNKFKIKNIIIGIINKKAQKRAFLIFIRIINGF